MIFERIQDKNIIKYDILHIKENSIETLTSIDNIAIEPIKIDLFLSINNLVNYINGLKYCYDVKVKPLIYYPIEITKDTFHFTDYEIKDNLVTLNYSLSKYNVIKMTCYIDGLRYEVPEDIDENNIIVRPILDGDNKHIGRHNLL